MRSDREGASLVFDLGPVALEIVRAPGVPVLVAPSHQDSLLLCLAGEAFFVCEGVTRSLTLRDCALRISGREGTLLPGEGAVVACVGFSNPLGPSGGRSERWEGLRRLLPHVIEALPDQGVFGRLEELYGQLILETAKRDMAREKGPTSPLYADMASTRFQRAQEFIRARLSQRVSLGEVAAALSLSPRSVQLLFQKEAGMSLSRFISRVRLAEAHERLLNATPNANVTQIALDCGFTHAGLFSATYRKLYGELPRETLARGRSSDAVANMRGVLEISTGLMAQV